MNSFTTQLHLFLKPKYLATTLLLAGGAAALVALFGIHLEQMLQHEQKSMQPITIIVSNIVSTIYPILAIIVFVSIVDLMWNLLGKMLRRHEVI